jgi:hypothetical protein
LLYVWGLEGASVHSFLVTQRVAGMVAAGFVLAACAPSDGKKATVELPPEEQAVYEMLARELADFIENDYQAENGLCVGVDWAPNAETVAVPDAVFLALEEDAAGAVKLIPYSPGECPFDKILETVEGRWLLFASKTVPTSNEAPNWLAGVTNPALYGWGHVYRVEFKGSKVSIKALGEVMS